MVTATSMTSKGTEEMSPANIGRFEIYSHKFVEKVLSWAILYKTLNDWSRGKQFILFPENRPFYRYGGHIE